MLNVVCVKWGTAYGPEYVDALHAGVSRHLHVPFVFKCFTDDPRGLGGSIFTPPLPGDLASWWNKLWLFNEYAFHSGTPVLFFDLDTVIMRKIDPLVTVPVEFACLQDFYRPRGLGSGVMIWRAGTMNHLWDDFVRDGKPDLPGGDQAYIEVAMHRRYGNSLPDSIRLQALFPGMFASYKKDCLTGPPDLASVVCFHGQPKPHNCGADWVDSNWSLPLRASSAA